MALVGENLQERVTFTLGPRQIVVKKTNGDQLFQAEPSLNAEGHCILRIENEEYSFWRMRMKALERLFFVLAPE